MLKKIAGAINLEVFIIIRHIYKLRFQTLTPSYQIIMHTN